MEEGAKQKVIKGSAAKAFAETLAKSIERGNDIATKVKQLKESLTKRDKGTAAKGLNSSLKKNAAESPVIFPLESKGPYRETVLESSDNEKVKTVVEKLIAGLKPESQQNAFDESLLFRDKEFTPDNAIKLPTDKLDKDFERLINFDRIQWKRIKEISPNPLQCGFDQLPTSQDSPDKSLIIQGLLGDNWFLSALSIVFKHDSLWTRVVCAGHFEKYRDYGLYVFRFCKDNRCYHVIVDDIVPVVEKSTGAYVPVFARCLNGNLFWVSLVEKAYAKLHCRYYALHNGCIEDALYDLTGMNAESVVLDLEHAGKGKEFMDAMKILTLSGACIATSISTERVQYSKAQKDEIEASCDDAGLLVNYWYHFKDIRDIGDGAEKESDAVYNLVQLECPWGIAVKRGKIWKGDFGPKSERWTETFKARFNDFYPAHTNRYGDLLFGGNFSPGLSGLFTLPLEAFAGRFNTLVVLREFPHLYSGVEYEGVWTPSYGHPHVKCSDWMNNPHYVFRVESRNVELTSVVVVLQQKDPRFVHSEHNAKARQLSIGLVIMSMSLTEDDTKFYDPKRMVGFVKPLESRFVTWSSKLKSGKYNIIPVTKTEGDVGPYILKVYYSCRNDNIVFYKGGSRMILEKEKLGEESTMRVVDTRLAAGLKAFLAKSDKAHWAEQVLTPFTLDELLNPETGQGSTVVRAARNRSKLVGRVGRECGDAELRFYDAQLDREREYLLLIVYRNDRISALFGIDVRARWKPAGMEAEESKAAYIKALRGIEGTLDLAHYSLGDT